MKTNAKTATANITAKGMPSPSPIIAPVERPVEGTDAETGVELGLLINEEVCDLEDVSEDEAVGEVLVVVADKSKSLSLYLIHIAGAGITFSRNVNVLENPTASPSPVYAIVVITVESILEVQKVDGAPPSTAGAVPGLKPG
ncbi:hypothetical protein EPUS_08275 [Endocarpon pusillum Z07020]|uniref:Uncharacterized protein n=1 Tax=Endocarpon pusillum (strain Z07020 / HMAS-L-300199) TaxID=1263415 RepID=U1GM57_ENDPU|nr:uncharacterized protein EPUS_08275 [Endocarpon pusillum Z07020]ERF73333.1 hypothetical protein EPUS_08275 [Endocarpon pusillum Z07020]